MKHVDIMTAYRAIERAQITKKIIADVWKVDESKVIWRGANKFIVIKDGKEIWVNGE